MVIGAPRVGQVVRYSFLWRNGHEKDRPAVIIAAVRKEMDGNYRVSTMPITHKAPVDPVTAIEIPKRLKNNLKLDDERSWIIMNEINQFLWPGYDLRPIPGSKSRWEYGQLPSDFFDMLTKQLIELTKIRKINFTER